MDQRADGVSLVVSPLCATGIYARAFKSAHSQNRIKARVYIHVTLYFGRKRYIRLLSLIAWDFAGSLFGISMCALGHWKNKTSTREMLNLDF